MTFGETLWPLSPPAITILATVSAALSVTVYQISKKAIKPKSLPQTIPSPSKTLLSQITPTQASKLAYSPNLLPGARDVDTPYGSMRVYEWGSESGRKVILIHGDTTPGPMLLPIAEALVGKGCRVMIFDLFGRGYSDTPLNVPHDAKLFNNQILYAAASSSLAWTGTESGGFSIIAFSLGGGITMSFAAKFPYLVNSIILLAPAGILRSLPEDYQTIYFRYPRLVPSSYLRRLVANILGVKLSGVSLEQMDSSNAETRSRLDVPAIVQWQFDNHNGFVHSFINTIAHGPLMHQHSDWRIVADIFKGNAKGSGPSGRLSKLFDSRMLVIFGDSDGIAAEKEISADMLKIFDGGSHLEFKVVPGGHGFPVPSSDDVVKHIFGFWKL